MHVSPSGAGQPAKPANQIIVSVTIGAVAEAFLRARRSGADPAKLRETLRGGSAESRPLELHGQRMAGRDLVKGPLVHLPEGPLGTPAGMIVDAILDGLGGPDAATIRAVFANNAKRAYCLLPTGGFCHPVDSDSGRLIVCHGMTQEPAMTIAVTFRASRRVLMLLGLLLACPAQAQVVEAARAALPDAVRAAGVLRVATSTQWPPFAFQGENGEADGIDIRLVRLLAAKLGLKPAIEDVKFPAIVPGVSSGRYDVGVNQINITAERAKAVDFLPYSQDGLGLLVRRGTMGLDVNNLCGRTLALTQGSAQVAIAERLSAQCKERGQKEIAFLFFPNSADTYLALANGRGDGFLIGKASGIYIARGNNKLDMTAATLAGLNTVSGIAIAKGNTALREALRLALEDALADGSYAKVMADFGVPDSALTAEQIRNPAPV